MRRAVVTAFSTVAGVVMLLSFKPHHSDSPGVSAPPSTGGAGSPGASSGAEGSRTGSYTGSVITTRYGPVQVEATLKSGRLTAVKVLRAPSENGRDRDIARDAVPRLTQEALEAQSARIDAVSGATYTSDGYVRSLQSALDKAHG
ncbi:FMN-binding protein [Streptomyces sp. 891-h]|uniref:FMN-binding protein n=1 Tax=unclassified Streptomyces TaxID=2593676 RepID=UPI001FAA7E7B|nr:FMN-binding protein [Streptomyces sp. 891-h]UNZ16236.1 FMN-binding protein [Streptomyces sp. 891-h]